MEVVRDGSGIDLTPKVTPERWGVRDGVHPGVSFDIAKVITLFRLCKLFSYHSVRFPDGYQGCIGRTSTLFLLLINSSISSSSSTHLASHTCAPWGYTMVSQSYMARYTSSSCIRFER